MQAEQGSIGGEQVRREKRNPADHPVYQRHVVQRRPRRKRIYDS
jgi:hypothetical protein